MTTVPEASKRSREVHDAAPAGQTERDLNVILVIDGRWCGCCVGTGEHPCGGECTSCDGSGVHPDSPICWPAHGADCSCDMEALVENLLGGVS